LLSAVTAVVTLLVRKHEGQLETASRSKELEMILARFDALECQLTGTVSKNEASENLDDHGRAPWPTPGRRRHPRPRGVAPTARVRARDTAIQTYRARRPTIISTAWSAMPAVSASVMWIPRACSAIATAPLATPIFAGGQPNQTCEVVGTMRIAAKSGCGMANAAAIAAAAATLASVDTLTQKRRVSAARGERPSSPSASKRRANRCRVSFRVTEATTPSTITTARSAKIGQTGNAPSTVPTMTSAPSARQWATASAAKISPRLPAPLRAVEGAGEEPDPDHIAELGRRHQVDERTGSTGGHRVALTQTATARPATRQASAEANRETGKPAPARQNQLGVASERPSSAGPTFEPSSCGVAAMAASTATAATETAICEPRETETVEQGDPRTGAYLRFSAPVRPRLLRFPCCMGVETESQLARAGLHRLVRSLADRIDEIPAPQATALRTALGLEPATEVDRFLVGAAVRFLCRIFPVRRSTTGTRRR
jgi:hypothetical protein